jgi:hypothetical protein
MDPFHLIHHEVSGDADSGAGASDDAGTTGETDSAEAWSGPSKEEWEQTQQLLADYQAAQQGDEGEYEEEEEGDVELDPFSDKFGQQLVDLIQQAISPYATHAEQQMMSEANEKAMDIIADLEAKDGEFMNPEKSRPLARVLADKHFPEMAQKHADPRKAAEAALAAGVKEARELEQVYGEAYYTRKMNNLRGLAGAKTEPGASGREGASQQVTPEGGDELSLVSHHLGR